MREPAGHSPSNGDLPAGGLSWFENITMVAALVDRLTFRSHVLDMNGESYRLKSAIG